MSRDGLIKSRSSSVRGRGQNQAMGQRGQVGRFFGSRAAMLNKGPLRVTNRPSSYKIAKSFSRKKDILWTNALFEHGMAATGITGAESGTKLYISNLDYGVSNGDIKELFSEVGDLKRCTVHYDRNGHSSGSAEVIYVRRSDAIAAVKRYNNVQLDGKPMKIEIIGDNLGLRVAPRVNVVGGANGRGKRTVVMTPEFGQAAAGSFKQVSGRNRGRTLGRGGIRGQGTSTVRGRNLRGRGRRNNHGRNQPSKKMEEDLDRDLETYHAEAMNTS
ncbi:hypothetical protein KFK09_008976 [Dendrobium nobile]|uniref:RRM domain-containing protein n=1 Tax=Dendrobium nobile TaxID=94219 RepID=A0A8T3BLK3_DENNO|nr:hypothetical protein KFK09_008976 [Dendrobium nobile]